MDLPSKRHFSLLIIALSFVPFPHPVQSYTPPTGLNHTTYIYKACANRPFPGPTGRRSTPPTLSSFFQTLVAGAALSKSFRTTTAASYDGAGDAVSGHFNCRRDLSSDACRNCAVALSRAAAAACGGDGGNGGPPASAAARVQLAGCFVSYEADGFEGTIFDPEGGPQLLHKSCGAAQGGGGGGGAEVVAAALEALENDVVERGLGGRVERAGGGVRAAAECELGLRECECGDCVEEAVKVAVDECGDSLWAHIYMDSCFLSFTYSPANGAPAPAPGPTPSNNQPVAKKKEGSNMGKVVAIAAGVAAALFFGFIFLKFLKSLGEKDDDF